MRSTVRPALRVLTLLLLVGLVFPTPSAMGQSDVTQTLMTRETISYAPGAGTVQLDPDLTITGNPSDLLDAAVVSIGDGFVRNRDRLGINGQAGTVGTVDDLMWSYDAGVLKITGQATIEDYEAALRQVTFTHAGDGPLATPRTVIISLGSVFYFGENGHFYEFVPAARISWTDAEAAAEARTHAGLSGYLVTITSAEENDFVADRLVGGGWIGASDERSNKKWQWRTGPEAGTHFFTQDGGEDGCGEDSAETQPPGDQFTSWDRVNSREPNDFPTGCPGNEDFAYMVDTGLWNDWTDDGLAQAFGYMVEFGGMEGESLTPGGPVGTILIQSDVPSITIEQTWVGDDPQVATSFTVVPEVDGCTPEQTVSIPAGESSVAVVVSSEVDETACTYAVTEIAPTGYTVLPDEVTAVAVDGTAAFSNTEDSAQTEEPADTETPADTEAPMDALPNTGSTSNALVMLGLTLIGPGCLVLAGGRRALRRPY